jgi:hypothetical protein
MTALDGDMAPTYVSTTLSDEAGDQSIVISATPEDGGTLVVPPAETLAAEGDKLGTLALTCSAV